MNGIQKAATETLACLRDDHDGTRKLLRSLRKNIEPIESSADQHLAMGRDLCLADMGLLDATLDEVEVLRDAALDAGKNGKGSGNGLVLALLYEMAVVGSAAISRSLVETIAAAAAKEPGDE